MISQSLDGLTGLHGDFLLNPKPWTLHPDSQTSDRSPSSLALLLGSGRDNVPASRNPKPPALKPHA